jgi:glycine/D-amino acid oxidase-like deaminating enzyme
MASTATPVVIVIGGGIRGAALAAILTVSALFRVRLVEKSRLGGGASGSNHGRLHSGVWNWHLNNHRVVARNRQSLDLLRRLPGAVESRPGWYLVEDPGRVDTVAAFCEAHGIVCERADAGELSAWLNPEYFAAAFRVPEFSFRPAELAGRLAEAAGSLGGEVVFGRVLRIARRAGMLRAELESGQTMVGALMVNAMGGWVNDIETDLPIPRPPVIFHRWRLLCAKASDLARPPISAPVSVVRTIGGPLSAIPHGGRIVFGCDIPSERLTSQENGPVEQAWRTYDPSHPSDAALFEAHAPYFTPLAQLETPGRARVLQSCSGVYPEIGATTSDRDVTGVPTPYGDSGHRFSNGIEDYFTLVGGSATTAIVDVWLANS